MRESKKENSRPLVIISTLLIMYIITGLALLAMALLLLKLQPGENMINIGILTTYIVSCLLGGIIAGKRFRVHKFLWGLLMGAAYFLILLVGSFLLNRGISSDTTHIAAAFIMCMAAGMIGGMIS